MAIHSGAHSPSQPESPLVRLVEERGLRRFAFFFVTGEGEYLANGDEEKSGYVIDQHGRVFSFWTGWDAEHHRPIFSEWEVAEENSAWLESDEYRRARAMVGLDGSISALSAGRPEQLGGAAG